MELTREQALTEHRKMWNWIASETERRKKTASKDDYFLNHPEYEEIPDTECFCCEYDAERKETNLGYCSHCPIMWDTHDSLRRCISISSPFFKWTNVKDDNWELAAKYAREIANLPERKVK